MKHLPAGEIARRIDLFEEIRHPHPQLTTIHRTFDILRAEARAASARLTRQMEDHSNIVVPPSAFPAVAIFGPSGTAKTHVIKTYYEDVCLKENWPEGERRVVDFELSVDANKRQFQVDLLAALRDPDPDKGNDSVLRRRVRKLTMALRTDLVFADEIQHFIASDTKRRTMSVAAAIKKSLNGNPYALGLVGTEKAQRIFEENEELAQRVPTTFIISGCDLDRSDGRKQWTSFLTTFKNRLESLGILDSAATLITPETAGLLGLQVDARLGLGQRLIKASTRCALERGDTKLSATHIASAVDRNKALFGFKANFFAEYANTVED